MCSSPLQTNLLLPLLLLLQMCVLSAVAMPLTH
jgi:hypothetical protein